MGVSLSKRPYKPYRSGWDHDHCEFCGAKLSERKEDLNVGYTTSDMYHWVCTVCYEDFKNMFKWEITGK